MGIIHLDQSAGPINILKKIRSLRRQSQQGLLNPLL
jgi:hypothetical protein